ncbi:hypothetical protein HY490_02000 [Candidatus Woesearchaeota archaeon]|nr:hypothetical protein [Candidatus Woesearchaeota archaeon]
MTLDTLLDDVQHSTSIREECFSSVYDRGYFPNVARADARNTFDADLLTDTPRRQQLLSTYLPVYTERKQYQTKFGKAATVAAVGGLASALGTGLLALAGLTALWTGGVLAAYYWWKKRR